MAYAYNANGDLTNDGLRSYSYNAEGRLSAVTTGATDSSPTTRHAHNALGQRVFKTEPLYPPAEGDENDPGFFQGLLNFFTKLWGPNTSDAEKLGFAFMYDENGTLISETGTGGANSAGSTQYIYLPTANGPMLIAAVINGQIYAVSSDHLNTPRRLTDSNGQAVWQWSYSAFGDNQPTLAKYRFANLDLNPNPGTTGISEVTLNKRYDGQYFDKESGLHYNGFRTYCPTCGRYTQPDAKGLGGGWNRIGYVDGDAMNFRDPWGLDRWGSYGYGRYVPATNPSPTYWEKLQFPPPFSLYPEDREFAEKIALGFCGGGIGGAVRSIAAKGLTYSLDDLSKADGAADKGGFTAAGRSLQKHGSRDSSKWKQGDIDVNKPVQANQRGQDLVDDVLTSPGGQVVQNPRGGLDAVAPDGRVVRYNRDGTMQRLRE